MPIKTKDNDTPCRFSLESWAQVGTIVTAFAAMGSVWASIHYLNKQISEAHIEHQVTVILQLEDKFDSSQMKAMRRQIANDYIKHKSVDYSDVLDFFQTVGTLLKRDTIPLDLTYDTFFNQVRGYREIAYKYIQSEREKDKPKSDLWDNVDFLYDQLMAKGAISHGVPITKLRLDQDGRMDFVADEASL